MNINDTVTTIADHFDTAAPCGSAPIVIIGDRVTDNKADAIHIVESSDTATVHGGIRHADGTVTPYWEFDFNPSATLDT